MQKIGSDSDDDDEFDDNSFTSPPAREGSSRRAATKVRARLQVETISFFGSVIFIQFQRFVFVFAESQLCCAY